MALEYHTGWKREFMQMADPRKAKGKRYPWWVLLTLIAAAMASGQTFPRAISQWAQEHADLIRQQIWPRIPSDATVRRALQQMPVEQLDQVMHQGTVMAAAPGIHAHALDGKTIRGATTHGLLLTIDAMHTQQETTRLILSQGGHYLLIFVPLPLLLRVLSPLFVANLQSPCIWGADPHSPGVPGQKTAPASRSVRDPGCGECRVPARSGPGTLANCFDRA